MSITPEQFAAVWNDLENFPTIRDVAAEFGTSRGYCKNKASRHRARFQNKGDVPELVARAIPNSSTTISEEELNYEEAVTKEDCIEKLKSIYKDDPYRNITRLRFREETRWTDSTWTRYFGTFLEFKRQAGLDLTRSQHGLERKIAKHVSSDHYRAFNERMSYDDRYLKRSNSKIKTIVGASDMHDTSVDPFYLRVLIQACKMIQPDVINLSGDIFDLAEFGKYNVDPRDWDVVGRIKFVHNNILAPLREACPNTQIDFVEGNHEYRLLRHLADSTPALKAILSDLMGITVSQLLGLDQFEINYIAKGDLSAFNISEQKKEIQKSYVIYDEALLVHHHPHAKNWGLTGWNGHHHHWAVSNVKNALKGSYPWIQLGCGHRLNASYCDGEFWNMGFNIAHINTDTKHVNHEYVMVSDMACVGGVYYERQKDEF